MLHESGLKEIIENNLTGTSLFESAGHYWNVMSDVAGPLMEALEKAPQEKINKVRKAVIDEANNMPITGE